MADTGKLKRENTALLRQAMQNGSAGKNDLARLTHLSFPTVSRIVDEMVEAEKLTSDLRFEHPAEILTLR